MSLRNLSSLVFKTKKHLVHYTAKKKKCLTNKTNSLSNQDLLPDGSNRDDFQGEHVSLTTAQSLPLEFPTDPLRMLEDTFTSSPFAVHL